MKHQRYIQIIERLFTDHYHDGDQEVEFRREEILSIAHSLNIVLPKNLGDIIYTFRYREPLPEVITKHAPENQEWIIRPAGRGHYKFVLSPIATIKPNLLLTEIKIPDATPGIISLYALSDEQSLLAKIRYNRLIDIFSGVTCYSLQSHLRTSIKNIGQIETDEIYIGVDRRGAHYVFPIQAKGGKDRLSIIQIEQDVALCSHKFPTLICRPIAAQFINPEFIALFMFEANEQRVALILEKHYLLVDPSDLSESDLSRYSENLS